jgi:hypothetical protein
MPAIPEFVLRKLYVNDSLIHREKGFDFQLNNNFAPVTLTGFSLIIDNEVCDPGNVSISMQDMQDFPAGGITAEHPFMLAVNTIVEVRVMSLPPQKNLVIRAETKEAGVLQFGIPVSTVPGPQPIKKIRRTGWTKRYLNRLKYAAKSFSSTTDPRHPSYHYDLRQLGK